jgi:EAL domain-containing protein (putative c-di-GMP-specific phosphodiesterase class I)/CheY-like chemotaxis protein
MSTILVVEDEAIIRELVVETLILEGYEVLEAENGSKGLKVINQSGKMPDLIICDVMMPEMDGHGFILELQKTPSTASIPFIFLTALGTIQDFRKGMNSGADDYLVKPFKQEDLLVAVNSRLQKKARISAFYEEKNNDQQDDYRRRRRLRRTPTLTSDEVEIAKDLEIALTKEELYLNYQPQVAIASHHLVGCEALIRWQHPYKGFISPGMFIPIAEKIGLIKEVGDWVIESVLKQCQQWQQLQLPLVRVAINISAQQFHGDDLVNKLKSGVQAYNLLTEQVEVELTETLLVQNVEDSIVQLNYLRSEGFKVAIDDFGTGYSSLSYLQQFPFDVLKIDQGFVRNIDQNSKNKTITGSIISLAHQLDLQVIAEGVETWEEYEIMADLGCDELQGYLFSRPLSATDFTELLQRGINQPILPLR